MAPNSSSAISRRPETPNWFEKTLLTSSVVGRARAPSSERFMLSTRGWWPNCVTYNVQFYILSITTSRCDSSYVIFHSLVWCNPESPAAVGIHQQMRINPLLKIVPNIFSVSSCFSNIDKKLQWAAVCGASELRATDRKSQHVENRTNKQSILVFSWTSLTILMVQKWRRIL